MQKCLGSEVVVQQNSSTTTSSCRACTARAYLLLATFLAAIEADSLSSWLYYSRISEGDRVDLKGSTLHCPILISEKKITFVDGVKRLDSECSVGTHGLTILYFGGTERLLKRVG